MLVAVELVQNGMSIWKAAKEQCVNYKTLSRYVKVNSSGSISDASFGYSVYHCYPQSFVPLRSSGFMFTLLLIVMALTTAHDLNKSGQFLSNEFFPSFLQSSAVQQVLDELKHGKIHIMKLIACLLEY